MALRTLLDSEPSSDISCDDEVPLHGILVQSDQALVDRLDQLEDQMQYMIDSHRDRVEEMEARFRRQQEVMISLQSRLATQDEQLTKLSQESDNNRRIASANSESVIRSHHASSMSYYVMALSTQLRRALDGMVAECDVQKKQQWKAAVDHVQAELTAAEKAAEDAHLATSEAISQVLAIQQDVDPSWVAPMFDFMSL